MNQEAKVLVECDVALDDALDLAVKFASAARKYRRLYKRARKFQRCPYCGGKLIRIHIECHDFSGWMHCWTCNCVENEACGSEAVG